MTEPNMTHLDSAAVTDTDPTAPAAVHVHEFFQTGPLQVHELTTDFPLHDKMQHHCPLQTKLLQIDSASYPDSVRVKAHEPAFKRYRGLVQHAASGQTSASGVFFKFTGLLDANALVCGSYEADSEEEQSKEGEGAGASVTDTTTAAPGQVAASDETKVDIANDTGAMMTDILDQVQEQADEPPAEWEHHMPGSCEDMRKELCKSELGDKTAKTSAAHNTAFVDSLAACLTSKLVVDNVCPHFPQVYGVYRGVASKHHVEFTEEYYDHRDTPEFKRGVSTKRWQMVPQPLDVRDDADGLCGAEADTEADTEVDTDGCDDHSAATSASDEDDACSECSVCTNDSTNEHIHRDTLEPVALSEIDTLQGGGSEMDAPGTDAVAVAGTETTDLLADSTFFAELDTIDTPLRMSADHEDYDRQYFLQMHDAPVQVVAMEAFDEVFETVIRSEFRELRRCELLVAREQNSGFLFDDSDAESEVAQEGESAHADGHEPKRREGVLPRCARVAAYHWMDLYKRRRFERKWTAILAQVCMALVAVQHRYDMVHNDLHGHNILLAPTTHTHLRYEVNGERYHVPTYGYAVKIIDMGRTTFQLEDRLYMGDVYHPKGEAGEQYSYIQHHSELVESPEKRTQAAADEEVLLPNPGFDLARLACSILDEFYQGADPFQGLCAADGVAVPVNAVLDEASGPCGASQYTGHLFQGQQPTVSPFYNMLCEWITDSSGKPVNRFDNFDLYKQIARRMRCTLPAHQLQRPHFAQFKVGADAASDADTARMSPVYKLTDAAPVYAQRLPYDIERPPYTADSFLSGELDDGEQSDGADFDDDDDDDDGEGLRALEELLQGMGGDRTFGEGNGAEEDGAEGAGNPDMQHDMMQMLATMLGGACSDASAEVSPDPEQVQEMLGTLLGGMGLGGSDESADLSDEEQGPEQNSDQEQEQVQEQAQDADTDADTDAPETASSITPTHQEQLREEGA